MNEVVLVLIEQEAGAVTRPSLEACTLARRLAGPSDAALVALTMGTAGGELATVLGAHGASVLESLEHPRLEEYAPAGWGAAVAERVEARDATVVVAPASDRGGEVLAHVAARLDLPLAANCVEVAADGDGWTLTRLRWGGVLLEDARLDARRALLTVAPHHVTAEPVAEPTTATIERVAPDLESIGDGDRVRDRVARTEGIGLATAPVVISGGRGVGSAEGFGMLEELAEMLGGAVGCSRVATNAGWRSHSDQVGQTGTRVAPDLYVACGISGATQHWVGCMSAKRILAINTDPEAPMVTRAHYAVVGDLHALLPALIAEVRKRTDARQGRHGRG